MFLTAKLKQESVRHKLYVGRLKKGNWMHMHPSKGRPQEKNGETHPTFITVDFPEIFGEKWVKQDQVNCENPHWEKFISEKYSPKKIFTLKNIHPKKYSPQKY